MTRPEKHDVDYFPFFAKRGNRKAGTMRLPQGKLDFLLAKQEENKNG